MSEGKKKLSYQEKTALAAEIAEMITARAKDNEYDVLAIVVHLVSDGHLRLHYNNLSQ
jgi:protein required for attachment to host cells